MNRALLIRIAEGCRSLLGAYEERAALHVFLRLALRRALPIGVSPEALPILSSGYDPFADVLLEGLPPSVLAGMEELLNGIPPEAWHQTPELAGWLYQYYIAARKKRIFTKLKSGGKADKSDLPTVTQLFTPSWICRYLAEQAVGRLRGPEQEPTVMDPACGCGHLLSAAFDVLHQLNLENGCSQMESVRKILNGQLYGLDIDETAVQIARFVLLMKGAAIDPTLWEEDPVPSILPIVERSVSEEGGAPEELYRNAGELGSLLRPEKRPELSERGRLPGSQDPLLRQTDLLCGTYDAVITNPPYLGRRSMSSALASFLDAEYPLSRNDLFACFLERAIELVKPGGYHGAINQHSWMYLSGYEGLRRKLLRETTMLHMLHLGSRAFEDIGGEVVQTAAFVLRKLPPSEGDSTAVGEYWRLTDLPAPEAKEAAYRSRDQRRSYTVHQSAFGELPGALWAYGLSAEQRQLFQAMPPLGSRYAVKKGMDTGDNARFVKYWFEVPPDTLSFRSRSPDKAEWFPYNKGGGSRRWYGNHYFVVNWAENGKEIREEPRSNLRNEAYFFRQGITWSTVSTGEPSFRLLEPGFLFDNGGSCIFSEDPHWEPYSLLAFLNSSPVCELLSHINPTINIQPGDVAKLPFPQGAAEHSLLERLGRECVQLAREEWDEGEHSWNFKRHPLIQYREQGNHSLEEAFEQRKQQNLARSMRLLKLEEEIDALVCDLYGLPWMPRKRHLPPGLERETEARSLLSYLAGCLSGRYRDEVSPKVCLTGVNLGWIAEGLGLKKNETPEERVARYWEKEFPGDQARRFRRRPVYHSRC